MGRKLATRITTAGQFKRLLDALLSDLGKVNDYRTLLKNLDSARVAYWRGMSQSPAFWSTVQSALHEGTLHGLSRAYDQHDGALTLRTLLETVRANPPFLQRPSNFDSEQLQADLKLVTHDTHMPVEHLMMWRNQLIAHRDPAKLIEGRKLSEDYPLTWEDIDMLIEIGFTMLNRYGVAFFRETTGRNVLGHDDYLSLLTTLQSDADRRHQELLREIEEWNRTEG